MFKEFSILFLMSILIVSCGSDNSSSQASPQELKIANDAAKKDSTAKFLSEGRLLFVDLDKNQKKIIVAASLKIGDGWFNLRGALPNGKLVQSVGVVTVDDDSTHLRTLILNNVGEMQIYSKQGGNQKKYCATIDVLSSNFEDSFPEIHMFACEGRHLSSLNH